MTEQLLDDATELAHARMMRVVLDETALPPGVADPAVNFDAFVRDMLDQAQKAYYALPHAERISYAIECAREEIAWQKRTKAPDVLLLRTELWLARLVRASREAPERSGG